MEILDLSKFGLSKRGKSKIKENPGESRVGSCEEIHNNQPLLVSVLLYCPNLKAPENLYIWVLRGCCDPTPQADIRSRSS